MIKSQFALLSSKASLSDLAKEASKASRQAQDHCHGFYAGIDESKAKGQQIDDETLDRADTLRTYATEALFLAKQLNRLAGTDFPIVSKRAEPFL